MASVSGGGHKVMPTALGLRGPLALSAGLNWPHRPRYGLLPTEDWPGQIYLRCHSQ